MSSRSPFASQLQEAARLRSELAAAQASHSEEEGRSRAQLAALEASIADTERSCGSRESEVRSHIGVAQGELLALQAQAGHLRERLAGQEALRAAVEELRAKLQGECTRAV